MALGLLVSDRAVFRVIRAFQVYVLKSKTADGTPVSCVDFPGTYLPDDSRLAQVVVPPASIPWFGGTDEAAVEHIEVPAKESLVVVVTGLRPYGSGVHTVALGCEHDLVFNAGANEPVSVDVKATAGRACGSEPDCVTNLTCHTGPEFVGGYCAKLGCSAETDCPPGTACAADTDSGGLCLRACDTVADCGVVSPQSTQECVGRVGPVAGCVSVCVWPTWNAASACTASP